MKIKRNNVNILTYMAMIIYVFCYIYFPPVLSQNLLYIVGLFAWIFLIKRYGMLKKIIGSKYFRTIIFSLVFLCIYCFTISFYHSNSIKIAVYTPLFWLFLIIPTVIFTSIWMIERGYGFRNVINILLVVANIQGMLAVFSYINMSFHNWVLEKFIINGANIELFTKISNYRLNGLAYHLTNYAPLVSAFMIVVVFELSKTNWKYITTIPLMAASIILNSRTAAVICLLGIILAFLLKKNYRKISYGSIIIISISCISLIIVYRYLDNAETWNSKWFLDSFRSIYSFLFDNSRTGYFEILNDENLLRLPTGINLLIGVGSYVYSNVKYGFHTDVGYVNYIWMGGLIYFFLIFFLIFYILKPLSRESKKLFFIALVFIFVLNIKDVMFTVNEFMNLLFFLTMYKYIENKGLCQ